MSGVLNFGVWIPTSRNNGEKWGTPF
jgi:hypothetical protein